MNIRLALAVAALLAFSGCDRLPGRPGAGDEVARPEQVLDFNTLYKENCSGCHGADGKGGASIALRDPVYLAIADDAVIRNVASAGVPGTQMPPFAQSKGGMLTDHQIDVLVHGIRAWAGADVPRDGLPPYMAQSRGDPQRGAGVYATFCASCHGPDGQGAKGGSAIANGAYLSLVSDQYLRTIAIAGRPELGAPDWRSNVPGRPMTSDEISDVVAWLTSQRSNAK
ncbi:MAG TPA: c-type cytochrome [Bryobacteraceae bacterium]|jgi:cytochrome c oxidase cbb3-type subunit 3|nr:c-type cytochrome [Bryobacteraceae bacterium]